MIKISVLIPSRSRVRGLSAILHNLRFLESKQNEVTYIVGCDDDDQETIDFCKGMQPLMPLAFRAGPRMETMGSLINTLAECQPADVYCVINDDVMCLSVDWDKAISDAVEKTPYGLFWWDNPTSVKALFPIVTEKWRAAAGGIFSNNFPFWYDDLCLVELWTMTTDAESIILPIMIFDRPATITHRMRELTFWQKVYLQTRGERVKQGVTIAEKLGLPKPQIGFYLHKLLDNHFKKVSDEWIQRIEKNQGEASPPDQAYLSAKARAEKLLQQLAA